MTLVSWRDSCSERDLLVPVRGVDVEPVVVNSDSVIRVSRRYGDLEIGSEEIRGGGVESVDGGVLENEPGLPGTKDCPNDKDCYENNQCEDQNASNDPSEEFPAAFAMLATILSLRHGRQKV